MVLSMTKQSQHELTLSLRPEYQSYQRLIQQGKLIAGVDEVGRGPLIGAVVAGAVVLDAENPIRAAVPGLWGGPSPVKLIR